MATFTEINGLHRGLASDLRMPLGQGIKIEHIGDGPWARAREGTPVLFHLLGDRWTEYTRRMPVVPLLPMKPVRDAMQHDAVKPQPWVGWHEKWRKQPDDSFALLSAGWTVSWGQVSDDRKVKVLRGEWHAKSFLGEDNDEHKNSATNDAAQPHWHVDPPLPLWELPAPVPSPTGKLKELPPLSGTVGPETRLSIQRVHLAMGGWTNDEEPPQCWQLNLAADLGQLRKWAVRTLGYLQTQAAFFKPSLPDA